MDCKGFAFARVWGETLEKNHKKYGYVSRDNKYFKADENACIEKVGNRYEDMSELGYKVSVCPYNKGWH